MLGYSSHINYSLKTYLLVNREANLQAANNQRWCVTACQNISFARNIYNAVTHPTKLPKQSLQHQTSKYPESCGII